MVLIESFTHDADGNMTTRTNDSKRSVTKSDDTITFAWDDFASAALPKVKLMKVTSADLSGPTSTAKVDNRFDVNGIRKRKLDKAGNASAEYTTDIITLASDALGTSTLPTISYIQGHLLLGYEEDGDFRYFLTDGLSSVRDIIDDTGAVIKSYEFNEYGDLITSSGSGTNSPKTWIGGLSVNDDTADSGLYLMGYRHYSSSLGRFLNRDPIGFAGGLNLYTYPMNPVNAVDPSGLDGLVDILDPQYAVDFYRRKANEAVDRTGNPLDPTALAWSLMSVGTDMTPCAAAQRAATAWGDQNTSAVNRSLSTVAFALSLSMFKMPWGATAVSGELALDTNVVIAAVEQGQAGRVLMGKVPVVSPTAVREFLTGGGDINALRSFLVSNGGRVGVAADAAAVRTLQADACALGRTIHANDARIAASAFQENLTLLTAERRLFNNLTALGKSVLRYWP